MFLIFFSPLCSGVVKTDGESLEIRNISGTKNGMLKSNIPNLISFVGHEIFNKVPAEPFSFLSVPLYSNVSLVRNCQQSDQRFQRSFLGN